MKERGRRGEVDERRDEIKVLGEEGTMREWEDERRGRKEDKNKM